MKRLFTITTFIMFGAFFGTPVFADTSENIFYYFPNTMGYQSLEDHYRDIDILAPQIYTFGYDLKLGDIESDDAIKFAKKKRVDVMPLVVNANFDINLMSQLLANEDVQDDLIDDMIDEARHRDYIGWQLDFENINHFDRQRYVDFVKKVYKEFKKRDLVLSVAVIPRTTPYVQNSYDQDWSSGYDIGAIADTSDFVSIMSYDDPKSIGPVSSMTYLNKVLDQTLKDTPAEKISLGIPFYCWQYELGNSKKIANVTYEISANTQEKYKDAGVFSAYFDALEAEIFAFVKNGRVNYIWCDNEQSIEAKLDLVHDTGLRGISAWALGQEDLKVWKHF